MRILDFLGHGRENATRADVLAAKLETTPRGLRSLIMKARDAGEIILYAPAATAGTSYRVMTRKPHKKKWLPFTMSRPRGVSMG